MSKLRARLRMPSPAMIVAIVALIAALGGTAVAASVLTNKQFKNKAVRGPLQYTTAQFTVPAGSYSSGQVSCAPGTHPTGGGVQISNAVEDYLSDSYPTTQGWVGTVYNAGAVAHPATVYAVCAKVKKVR